MIDLQQTSGLPIYLDEEFKLHSKPPLREFAITTARDISEMRPVLMDPNSNSLEKTYYVYRGLSLPEDEKIVRDKHLTYDVTIIPPAMLGQELNKTLGHYHANLPEKTVAHPELYEVLHGGGIALLQKMDDKFQTVLDVVAIEAKVGDKIIYPPNYGHIWINTGNEPLVLANWLSLDYKPLYKEVADFRGMNYYVIKALNKPFLFIDNPAYKDHPPIRWPKPGYSVLEELGFTATEPMYTTAVKNLEKLNFLIRPHDYEEQLAKVIA